MCSCVLKYVFFVLKCVFQSTNDFPNTYLLDEEDATIDSIITIAYPLLHSFLLHPSHTEKKVWQKYGKSMIPFYTLHTFFLVSSIQEKVWHNYYGISMPYMFQIESCNIRKHSDKDIFMTWYLTCILSSTLKQKC